MYKKIFFVFILATASVCSQQLKSLSFTDVMKFRQIKEIVISDYGSWTAYAANPDRGNNELVINSLSDDKEFLINRGSKPIFSENEQWLSVLIVPDYLEAEEKKDDKPENDLLIINLLSGDSTRIKKVQSSSFSKDSKWIVYHLYKDEKKDTTKKAEKKNQMPEGSDLIIRNLDSKAETRIPLVLSFAIDSTSKHVAYVLGDTSGKSNGLFYIELINSTVSAEFIIDTAANGNYTHPNWSKTGNLAYLKSVFDSKAKTGNADLYLWNGKNKLLTSSIESPQGWFIPAKNKLEWSNDGERLFFGYKPEATETKEDTINDGPYDIEEILAKKELTVWHWNDPVIKTHEKHKWKEVKDQTYTAVYHLNMNKAVQLADLEMPYVKISSNKKYILGYSDVPYLKYLTWEGSFYDFYIVDLQTGKRTKFAERIENTAQLSPDGKYAAYYKIKNYFLYDVNSESTVNLTKELKVSFFNEDFDEPAEPPGYGIGGWLENDEAVLIYDKYDIWKFNTRIKNYENITSSFGRENDLTFRINKFDSRKESFNQDENLFLTAFHQKKKFTALFKLDIKNNSLQKLLDGNFKYAYKLKAAKEDKYIFTRETYTEYPDLWVTSDNFAEAKKISDLGNQTSGYAWGTSELVEWNSMDGIPLQGVIIKPGNYDPKKKYPVIVYFYEISSHRLFEFNDIVVNHRPNFAYYASNGYAVFLPDVKFEIGRPGLSATKCIVPGVQKLVDMGLADKNNIGLHGHSWGGYLTAIMVTQTNYFKCAVAGAPVSNMISAYSGIRLESGMARQFQYEKYQSRIGGSLWEYPERFIENSPVFFADKITTPLLIQHGDEDEAVPWFQSVELYLAMRRLGKDVVFLQYRGEPHHLKKYPNKLDYSIKMKDYFDHFLKQKERPIWLDKGIIYSE